MKWLVGVILWVFAILILSSWVARAHGPHVELEPCTIATCQKGAGGTHFPHKVTAYQVLAIGPTYGCEEQCTTVLLSTGQTVHARIPYADMKRKLECH